MKVFIVDTINKIPSHKQFQDFAKHLIDNQFQVFHFSDNKKDNYNNVNVIFWPKKSILKSFFIFFKYFLTQRPDIVIATFRGNQLIDLFSHFFKFKYIGVLQSDFYHNRWYNKYRFLKINKLLVLSTPMMFKIKEMYPHVSNKVHVIFNSYNFENILPMKNKEDIILHVGGLNLNFEGKLIKGTDVLIEAFINIKKKSLKYSNLKLVIIGDGSESSKLIKDSEKYQINFTGNVSNEDVHYWMSKSKIFVLPSRNDAFPNVLLEAMQNACTLIGTTGTGATDIIECSNYGFLVKKEDVIGLENAITTAFNHYENSYKCWEIYKEKREHFSRNNWIYEMTDLINK